MEVFAALADPVRREIVGMLAERERTAGEIASRFPITSPAISRHLRVLREGGVVTYRQDAQSRVYRLEGPALDEARQWMQAQLDVLHARFDRLGAHLDRMKERGD